MALLDKLLLLPRVALGLFFTVVLPSWKWIRRAVRTWKRVLLLGGALAGTIYFSPFLMTKLEAFSRRFPTFTWQLSAGIVAAAFFLLSLAAVLYVGFRFLASILAIELQVAREFQSANRVFKNFFQAKTKQSTEGTAIPVDEEVQQKLEDIRILKEKGLIKDDEIADFIREAYGEGDA